MKRIHKKIRLLACIFGLAILIVSLGCNIYFAFFKQDNDSRSVGYIKEESYLQDTEQIYIMESGILKNTLDFRAGGDLPITYDFDNEEYPELIANYQIDTIAGEGTEFDRALKLMNEFAPRLTHESNYDNHIAMDALSLLAYSLDNKNHGINCRNKAQILNEMCLALGIYARKVWINPNSVYDNDCHVVNEVWDTSLEKWIMLDITNNQYWIDENGVPLSILEIREKGANQEFCTPVGAGDNLDHPKQLQRKHKNEFLYIMKNLVYMEYCKDNTVGESDTLYLLCPKNISTDYIYILSESACMASPVKE